MNPIQTSLSEFELWLRSHRNLRPMTAAMYAGCIASLTRKIGRLPTVADVDLIRKLILERAVSTRRNLLTSLERWLEWTTGGPVDVGPIPRAVRKSPRWLSQEQVRALFVAARTPRETALLSILYHGGLRASEAAGLDWQDVNWSAGTVRVRGKGGTDMDIVLTADLRRALIGLWTAHGRACACPWVLCGLDPRVHLPAGGVRMTRSSVYHVVRRIGDRIGVRAFPHELRHSIATAMAENGAVQPFVQQHLRQADPRSTDVYFHVATRAQREAVNRSVPTFLEDDP